MMKNLVEPIKLTEPVKPVKNQSLSVNQQKPQQHEEQSGGQKDFQAMLDKQVQERRMQDKKIDSNKTQNKTADKPNESTSPKTDVAKDNSVTDFANVKTSAEVDLPKVATQQPKANVEHNPKAEVKLQADTVSEDQAETEAVVAKTDPKLTTETIQLQQPKDSKPTSKTQRQPVQQVSRATVEVDAEVEVKADQTAIDTVQPKQATVKTAAKVDNDVKVTDDQHTEFVDEKTAIKAEDHAQVAQSPQPSVAKHTANEVAKDTKQTQVISHTPSVDKQANVTEKHATKTETQATVKPAAQAETDVERVEVTAQTATKEPIQPEHTPNQSTIAELQKVALEKRHQAKQLQRDMSTSQLRATSGKESNVDSSELSVELTPRSERAADFIQTMSLQAATIKPAAQRPMQAETFKADELKAAVNKASESTSPIMTTQTTATANTAMQPSQVMAAAPMGSSNQIYAYPGKSGWNQAISQKVMYMVGASEQTARLSLNPPELGPLQVVIEVNDEKANTTFISDNEEVRQALEDGMDYLREKMDEAGISLGEANVNDGHRFNQPNQQEGFANRFNQNRGHQATSAVVSEEAVVSTKVQSSNNGLVDTFA